MKKFGTFLGVMLMAFTLSACYIGGAASTQRIDVDDKYFNMSFVGKEEREVQMKEDSSLKIVDGDGDVKVEMVFGDGTLSGEWTVVEDKEYNGRKWVEMKNPQGNSFYFAALGDLGIDEYGLIAKVVDGDADEEMGYIRISGKEDKNGSGDPRDFFEISKYESKTDKDNTDFFGNPVDGEENAEASEVGQDTENTGSAGAEGLENIGESVSEIVIGSIVVEDSEEWIKLPDEVVQEVLSDVGLNTRGLDVTANVYVNADSGTVLTTVMTTDVKAEFTEYQIDVTTAEDGVYTSTKLATEGIYEYSLYDGMGETVMYTGATDNPEGSIAIYAMNIDGGEVNYSVINRLVDKLIEDGRLDCSGVRSGDTIGELREKVRDYTETSENTSGTVKESSSSSEDFGWGDVTGTGTDSAEKSSSSDEQSPNSGDKYWISPADAEMYYTCDFFDSFEYEIGEDKYSIDCYYNINSTVQEWLHGGDWLYDDIVPTKSTGTINGREYTLVEDRDEFESDSGDFDTYDYYIISTDETEYLQISDIYGHRVSKERLIEVASKFLK